MSITPRREKRTALARGHLFGDDSPLLAPVLVAMACVLPFIPGLTGPFLLDDVGNIGQLLGVHADFKSIYAAIFNNGSGTLLRPVANLSFVANLLTAGPYPFAFKLTNLAIHLANGVLVFWVALGVLRLLAADLTDRQRIVAALFATAVWTIHPLQASSVLYVVQRMTLLAATFSLLAIGTALSLLSRPDGVARTWARGCAVFLGLTALATLSKENGALTPLLLASILLAATPQVQSKLLGDRNRKRFWGAAVAAPLLLGLLVLLGFRGKFIDYGADLTLLQRVLTEPFVLAGYLRSFFVPDPSSMGLFLDDTQVHYASEPLAWAALGITLALPVAAIALRRHWPVGAFAILWFLACHALESTIFPLELAFEHRNYLALLGPCLAVAHGMARISRKNGTAAAVLSLCVVAVLATATYQRSQSWSSEETFALTEVANHPDSIRAQNLAAIVERRTGNVVSPVQRMARMKKMYPGAFFPFAMDMDFACDIPGHQVNWRKLHQNALPRISSSEVLGFFNHTTIQVANGRCAGIKPGTLDMHLEALAEGASRRGAVRATQYLMILRASLHERAKPNEAAELMYAAAALDPASTDVWMRIAVFEMNRNRPARAIEVLDMASARLRPWSPAAVRLEELRESAAAMMAP